MEYLTPNFTKQMLKDYTVLVPNMCETQFTLLKSSMESEGYHKVELLGSGSSDVTQLGLKYVHNDTCYPALIVIGQFLEALESGKYDLDHTALIISQSGGGCRASNYIKLLRKALVRSGHNNIPVASINANKLEDGSMMPVTLKMILKIVAGVEYGDLLEALKNQTIAYEINKGDSEKMLKKWLDKLDKDIRNNKNYLPTSYKKIFREITKDFASIPVNRVPKVKVGVVGEIYVKFSPTGNNNLMKFLQSQDCEVNMPGLMGYVEYCCANNYRDYKEYGMAKTLGKISGKVLKFLNKVGNDMSNIMREYGFYAPCSFYDLMKKPDGILDLGTKMGEGWLLTAEMVELIEGGYENIVCAQPFGCLPNHICGKGVINVIRSKFPKANITPIDYDPSATKVNQENRIKLMLAVARENLNNK